MTTEADENILLVPVAAIMVASIRFNCLEQKLNLKYRGANVIECNAAYRKGDEMGYFEHGSTIILFTTDKYEFCDDVASGSRVAMGQALLRKKQNVHLSDNKFLN
jgi:phosphatidylserine decarboxylase